MEYWGHVLDGAYCLLTVPPADSLAAPRYASSLAPLTTSTDSKKFMGISCLGEQPRDAVDAESGKRSPGLSPRSGKITGGAARRADGGGVDEDR